MKIIVHKGTNEIGGSCIEVSTDNTTILLDYGTPLKEDSETFSIEKSVDAILISHPHQDHYGEIIDMDSNVPVYCGALSLELMNAVRVFTGQEKFSNEFHHFKAWKKFTVGDFVITPYLVDHSATDAYAFLIEAEGQKVLYSGDFRANGRKSKLFDAMIADKNLHNVDVLLMEGTMIERENGDFPTEQSVEEKIYETIAESQHLSFIIASSQNVDTLVSAYRACLRAEKVFVVDIYTAWILENIKQVSQGIMHLDLKNVRVYKPTKSTGSAQYGKVKADEEYFKDFRFKIFKINNIITFDEMAKSPQHYVLKCSPWYIENIIKSTKQEHANIIYSQWLGYMQKKFSDERTEKLYSRLKSKYHWVYAHTSGHADLVSLKRFTESLQPKKLIPIHTERKEDFVKYFHNVYLLEDGDIYDTNEDGITRSIVFEEVYSAYYDELLVDDLVDFKADTVDLIRADLQENFLDYIKVDDNKVTLNYKDYNCSVTSEYLDNPEVKSVEVLLDETIKYGELGEVDVTSDLFYSGDGSSVTENVHECIENGNDCNFINEYSYTLDVKIILLNFRT